MKRLMEMKWMIASFFLVALVAAVAIADTFQGKPNPYGKGVTITVPTGTYSSAATPSSSGLMTHTGDAGFVGNVGVTKALVVGQTLNVNGVTVLATDAGIGGNATVSGSLGVGAALGVGTTLGVLGVTTLGTDAGVAGNMTVTGNLGVGTALGVTGDLLAAGGITVGSGTEITAVRRGTGSIYAGDAGVALGACEPAQNVTVTGVNAAAHCVMGTAESLIAAGYSCQPYYASASTVGVKCCCVGAANCAYVAPVTAGVICFDP